MGRPEETAKTVSGGWLHTGDVATVAADGRVRIIDRIKDMYISGGENVYPAEIEDVLYRHPAAPGCAPTWPRSESRAIFTSSTPCPATPPGRSSKASYAAVPMHQGRESLTPDR